MNLQKPFDLQALVEALKAKAIPEAEKFVTKDGLPVLFDWLNSSVKLESASNPLLAMAVPVIEVLESKALDAIEKAFGADPAP
jgi:hypothetical protein